jgi:biopolymer transport protein ExbD
MHWGKVMNLQTRSREEPEINLTSLIDVVLLLLVFFMITTSFVRESKIGIRLPEASSTSLTEVASDAIVIAVTAQGSYLVNGRALLDSRPETLAGALREIAGDVETKGRITVTADAEASHQAVITAMDVAGRQGFIEINIATVRSTRDQ